MKKRVLYAILDGIGFGALFVVAEIYLLKHPADSILLLKGAIVAALLIITESTVVKINRG